MKYLVIGVTIWGDVMQIEEIILREVLVKCTSKEECQKFLSIVEDKGIFWNSGINPTREDYWSLHSRKVIYYHIVNRSGNTVLKYLDYISPEFEGWEIVPSQIFFSNSECETNLLSFLEEVYFDG